MSAVLTLGQELLSGIFRLKYNSQQNFSVFIWDDEAHLVPSNLSATTVTLEIDQPTVSGLAFTGTVVGATNEVQFSITATQSTVTWDKSTFRLVYVNSGLRNVILSGEVRVQR